MSLTHEAIANIRHRLMQEAARIDSDPNIRKITCSVVVNPRNHKVERLFFDVETAYDPAPPGVVVAEELDTH